MEKRTPLLITFKNDHDHAIEDVESPVEKGIELGIGLLINRGASDAAISPQVI